MRVSSVLKLQLALTALVFLGTIVTTHAQPADRLPQSVTPTHYRLELTIDPAAEHITGRVEIDIDLLEQARDIKLHGENLVVNTAEIRLPSGGIVGASYTDSSDNGFAIITSERPIAAGKVTLIIDYSAPLSESRVGIYRSRYKEESQVYSQMQPIRARKSFPSFDEPRFKTPFDVTITHRSKHRAISNGPALETIAASDGLVRTRFATTQPLPTYLVAFAVGEFDVVEWEPLPPTKLRNRPVQLRGIAPKGDGEKLRHVLEITRPLFELMEDWFDVPYPYAKLDLIAAHDFQAWGMENAGAIIYRADRILLPDPPSVYAKRRIASLHAHELAHSWFGNYVTPRWWDDIWLNESFATWMASRANHLWKPEEFASYKPIERAAGAMWDDRLVSARLIRQPIKTDGDIQHAFSSASYSKGNGVIAMAENFLGEKAFRQVVQNHIKAHPHGVATTTDFLTALSEEAGDSRLSGAVKTFLNQPGVPLVKTSLSCGTDRKNSVLMSQSRYLPLGSHGESDRKWQIPLCLAYGDENGQRHRLCHLVADKEDEVSLPEGSCPKWLLPNGGGAAYMVFDLDKQSWDKLTRNFDALSIPEKISTASSVQTAYLAGRIDTDRLLQFAKLLATSENWAVSRTAMQMFRTIKHPVLPRESRSAIDAVGLHAFAATLADFDTSIASFARADPDPVKAQQRADLLWFLALDMGDKKLRADLADAGRRYVGFQSWTGFLSKKWAMNWDTLHPNFVWLGLMSAMEETGLPFAEHLISLLPKDFNRAMHNSLLAALGNSTDPDVVDRVRKYMLHPGTPVSDLEFLLGRQSRRADNAEGLRSWLFDNYDQLLKILPEPSHPWIVWYTAGACSTKAHDEIKAFFGNRVRKLAGAKRALENVLENVSLCTALKDAQRPGAVEALLQ